MPKYSILITEGFQKSYVPVGDVLQKILPGVIDGVGIKGSIKNIVINGEVYAPDQNGVVNVGVIKGEKGDKGDTVVLDTTSLPLFKIVNDVTTGGEGDALSAEMGKRLALGTGTYAEALTRSRNVLEPFAWIWEETVNNVPIRKPIWHIGNSVFIDAAGGVVSVQPSTVLEAPSMSPASSQLPAGGGTVEITGPAGASIYYTLDGSTPTDQSTLYNGLINVTADKTIKAIAKDGYGYSAVTTETYTVAVDHKLQFKIKLTGDNSTEYVPVTGNGGAKYNMTVDWGDGTTTDYSNNGADMDGVNKGCSHTYSGSKGDEFTITLRGSRIDSLMFASSCHNTGAITEIVDNSLECDTNFRAINPISTFNFGDNCTKVCANALQNNIGRQGLFCTNLTSIPSGLLSHMTKNPNGISTINSMFKGSTLDISSSLMAELKSIINTVVNFDSMFYEFKGSVTISDDFFDDVVGEVTSVWGMTHSAKGITGDAKKIYDALSAKASQSITSDHALTCSSLTNRNQVPTTWGGTMS